MEYFDWMGITQRIGQIFVYYRLNALEGDARRGEGVSMMLQSMYAGVFVGLGIFLITLIFGGIGLYKIAQKAGIAHPWLGFLPFVNTWYVGKIAGEANFFGQKMKRAGLYAMLLEIFYAILLGFSTVLQFLLMRPEYFTINYDTVGGVSVPYVEFDATLMPQASKWIYYADLYTSNIAYVLRFLVIVFLIVTFMAFYRKYYAKGPVIMSILSSLLPFRGFVLFAVRNNAPVDYQAYLRRRAEEYARRNAPYGGYGQGGYGGYGSASSGGNTPQDDPFTEFKGSDSGKGSGSDDDPFTEFN